MLYMAVTRPRNTEDALAVAIPQLISSFSYLWRIPVIQRVHMDRVPGVVSAEGSKGMFSGVGMVFSTTEGYTEGSGNPVAEMAVGLVSRTARASLSHINDVRKASKQGFGSSTNTSWQDV
eukprot:GHVN01024508.1.p3 GENE.GHVN01024508.1~~GHVN01024508.1.p3  ORF type:complete len:120 (+),score=8.65 GHVN01024508.1:1520-1879(+)